jgi:hypothetical protein
MFAVYCDLDAISIDKNNSTTKNRSNELNEFTETAKLDPQLIARSHISNNN